MSVLSSLARVAAGALLAVGGVSGASAQAQVLNLYSARHYQTDEALYANFTKATGIRVNRVDADDAGILARLRSEGSSSPADVILLVDAARLFRAESDGLFAELQKHFDEEQIIELTYIASMFMMNAGMIRALRLEYDDYDERVQEMPSPPEYRFVDREPTPLPSRT